MSAVAKNEVLSELAIMGYDEKYIARAIKIHSKSKFGTNYNLSLLVEIIDRLKQKDAIKNSSKLHDDKFCAHFASAEELLQYLNHSNLIDYRFENGRYVLCKVIEKDLFNEYKILLHPASQPLGVTKHNKYCLIYNEYKNLAIQKSITLRRITSTTHVFYNVGIDQHLDINPSHKHESHAGWKHGEIIKLDADSSQVKVAYYANNKNHSYWIHLENAQEAAPFNAKYNPLKDHMMGNFSEYADNNALKRFTSMDVIANKAAQTPKAESIMAQLENFGYTKPLIIAAIESIPVEKDQNDLNIIIEVIEKLKAEGDQKTDDFDANLSSMMVGNDLMMDDIIDAMELGDDGNNDDEDEDMLSTPMGPTPMGQNDDNSGGLPAPVDYDDDDDLLANNNDAPVAFGGNNHIAIAAFGGNNNNKNKNPLLMGEIEGGNHKILNKNNNENNDKLESRKRSQSKAQKLWKSGKKALKKRKNKNKIAAINGRKAAIFGIDPRSLQSTQQKEYLCAIPNVLLCLSHHLFVNSGHLIEGIFRIAPNKEKCRAIEDELNDGKLNEIEFVNVKADIIANLIKLWFRQLPDPLLQDIVFEIESCQNVQQVENIIRNDINEPKQSYFLWLLDLCCNIIEYESTNKMGIKAISVVIAPNLYDPAKINNSKVMSFSSDIIKFLHFSIDWRKRVRSMQN